jgi:FAD/FMN-containing dehydrogenase
MRTAKAETLITELAALLGPAGLLTEAADVAPYGEDWRRLYNHRPLAVARPANTADVAAVVRAAVAAGVGVVPQGGNTSLVGGAVPTVPDSQLVLSLSRLRTVRAVDPLELTLTAEAGVTLQAAQEAAAAAGCLLPLSISAEGTAQLGGILAANAGGNNTLRYGNARDLVLGLEVVLADGSVWEGLRRLRKDNTGYCLRQLFVGSEGTLGVITACVLKLAPRPRAVAVALCAVPSVAAALALLGRLQNFDASLLQAFEYMSGEGVALVLRYLPDTRLPLTTPAAHYVLVELATPRPDTALDAVLEELLAAAMEADVVTDAVLARSEGQRAALWRLREEHSEAQKRAGANVKNDVSVPIARLPELIARASAACAALVEGIRIVPFGHLGDGNVHFNLVQPEGMDPAAFLAREGALMEAVCAVVRDLDGSFSAEHGVGALKPPLLAAWRGGPELALMRQIKNALDPLGLMNPGKLLP